MKSMFAKGAWITWRSSCHKCARYIGRVAGRRTICGVTRYEIRPECYVPGRSRLAGMIAQDDGAARIHNKRWLVACDVRGCTPAEIRQVETALMLEAL